MIQDLFGLKDKIALVTGSGRGIGFTLARGLARAGCTVVLNDIEEDRLSEAVNSLAQNELIAHGSVFDVTDETAIAKGIDAIEKTIGPIDVLVNNAGIQIRGPLENFNSADFRRVIDINLTGAFLVAKTVVQGMIRRKAGKIINVCSIQSELARPTIAPYTASKGALRNLTRGMATDWGKYNIQVNAISPGYFKTEMTRALYEDEKFDAWLRSRTPANRWGDPEELVGAVIFLASRASDYINGHNLFVDGGMMACV